MKLNFRLGSYFYFFILIISTIVFSSCRTTRSLPKAEVKPITAARLLNKIEQNAFDYEYFTVKRINCQFSGNDTKVSFVATLKAQKDKAILISISKLSIPVGSVMLTPDSVKYVNYLEKSYFIDDYTYLSEILNVELDFETIQTILSSNVFSYQNNVKNKDLKNFETSIENGFYVLISEKENKMMNERRSGRFDKDAFILQKMFFDPTSFSLTRMTIDDKTNSRKVEFRFADFEKIRNKNYPGSIDMYFTSSEDNVSLKLKTSGFSSEKIDSFTLNIPEKYEQLTTK